MVDKAGENLWLFGGLICKSNRVKLIRRDFFKVIDTLDSF